MCPLCITAGTLYLASAGAGSAGGLAAVAAKMMRRKKGRKDTLMNLSSRSGSVTRSSLIPRSSRR